MGARGPSAASWRASRGEVDMSMFLGVLLLVSATVVLVNLITDVVYALLDPRVRYR